MYKTLFLLPAKPGMSRDDFKAHYEGIHSKFIKYLPGVRRYVRRYVTPLPIGLEGEPREPAFDVLMEMWFDDEAAMRAAMSSLADPARYAEVVADEENLFDRSRFSPAMALTVEEHETDLSKVEFVN